MFNVLVLKPNGERIVEKDSIKKLKYLNKTSNPRFTIMLITRRVFLRESISVIPSERPIT